MNARLPKIITRMPLSELWDDNGSHYLPLRRHHPVWRPQIARADEPGEYPRARLAALGRSIGKNVIFAIACDTPMFLFSLLPLIRGDTLTNTIVVESLGCLPSNAQSNSLMVNTIISNTLIANHQIPSKIHYCIPHQPRPIFVVSIAQKIP